MAATGVAVTSKKSKKVVIVASAKVTASAFAEHVIADPGAVGITCQVAKEVVVCASTSSTRKTTYNIG